MATPPNKKQRTREEAEEPSAAAPSSPLSAAPVASAASPAAAAAAASTPSAVLPLPLTTVTTWTCPHHCCRRASTPTLPKIFSKWKTAVQHARGWESKGHKFSPHAQCAELGKCGGAPLEFEALKQSMKNSATIAHVAPNLVATSSDESSTAAAAPAAAAAAAASSSPLAAAGPATTAPVGWRQQVRT